MTETSAVKVLWTNCSVLTITSVGGVSNDGRQEALQTIEENMVHMNPIHFYFNNFIPIFPVLPCRTGTGRVLLVKVGDAGLTILASVSTLIRRKASLLKKGCEATSRGLEVDPRAVGSSHWQSR